MAEIESSAASGASTIRNASTCRWTSERWRMARLISRRKTPGDWWLPQAKTNRRRTDFVGDRRMFDRRTAKGRDAMIDQQIKIDHVLDIAESEGADGNAGLAGNGKSALQLAGQPLPA